MSDLPQRRRADLVARLEAKRRESLRQRRLRTLETVWRESLPEAYPLDYGRFVLSKPRLFEVVEHYLTDVEIIRLRYRIGDMISLAKVAGVMTSLIVRYQPIIRVSTEPLRGSEVFVNEMFAILHGLSIISDGQETEVPQKLLREDWFSHWLRDFLFLLRRRNHTPEGLSFAYETLRCLRYQNIFSFHD